MIVVCKENLKFNGKRYAIGDTIDGISSDQAGVFFKAGLVVYGVDDEEQKVLESVKPDKVEDVKVVEDTNVPNKRWKRPDLLAYAELHGVEMDESLSTLEMVSFLRKNVIE